MGSSICKFSNARFRCSVLVNCLRNQATPLFFKFYTLVYVDMQRDLYVYFGEEIRSTDFPLDLSC